MAPIAIVPQQRASKQFAWCAIKMNVQARHSQANRKRLASDQLSFVSGCCRVLGLRGWSSHIGTERILNSHLVYLHFLAFCDLPAKPMACLLFSTGCTDPIGLAPGCYMGRKDNNISPLYGRHQRRHNEVWDLRSCSTWISA
jgi:hypothetical protein